MRSTQRWRPMDVAYEDKVFKFSRGAGDLGVGAEASVEVGTVVAHESLGIERPLLGRRQEREAPRGLRR